MLIEPQGIKNLDGEHCRQLGSRGLRRKNARRHGVRAAFAGALVAWATRIAPEEPVLLRTRSAPS